jgi:hypothetical protein
VMLCECRGRQTGSRNGPVCGCGYIAFDVFTDTRWFVLRLSTV